MTDSERLARIETLLEIVDQRTILIERSLNGGNGVPGLIVRVDRLERAEEREVWVFRAIFTALIALIASRVAEFFGFFRGN